MPQRQPRAPKPGQPEPAPGDLKALFGRNVRTERVRQNKTQQELADAAGFTHQYVSKIAESEPRRTVIPTQGGH